MRSAEGEKCGNHAEKFGRKKFGSKIWSFCKNMGKFSRSWARSTEEDHCGHRITQIVLKGGTILEKWK